MKKKECMAYICKTDWDHHIPDDPNGIEIYFSEADLRKNRLCVDECGLVKLKITLEEVLIKGTM